MFPFETLERRALLSGNVSAVADTQHLILQITGDGKDNQIEVTLFNKNQGYLLTGLKGTTINGNPSAVLKTTSAFNIQMSLGGGNDGVWFDGNVGTQNLSISTGGGKDSVRLSGITVFGNLAISTGGGKDLVSLSAVHVTKDLSIFTAGGKDKLIIAPEVTIDGHSSVSAGHGKNLITGVEELLSAELKKHKSKKHHHDD